MDIPDRADLTRVDLIRADPPWPRRRGSAGQTTAEYALVILGAAALATLIIAWATQSNAVGRLFDAVLDRVLGSAG